MGCKFCPRREQSVVRDDPAGPMAGAATKPFICNECFEITKLVAAKLQSECFTYSAAQETMMEVTREAGYGQAHSNAPFSTTANRNRTTLVMERGWHVLLSEIHHGKLDFELDARRMGPEDFEYCAEENESDENRYDGLHSEISMPPQFSRFTTSPIRKLVWRELRRREAQRIISSEPKLSLPSDSEKVLQKRATDSNDKAEEELSSRIDSGIDRQMYGCSDLQTAAAQGDCATVEELLRAGENINEQGGPYGSALQAASARNHCDTVKLLLDHGADCNLQRRYGEDSPALQIASANGNLEIVKLLLEYGAEVNLKGGKYNSALQAASYMGHYAVVELLLREGGDFNIRGGQYGTSLQLAATANHANIVKLLMAYGADVHAKGGRFGTAIEAARRNGNNEVLEVLEMPLDIGCENPRKKRRKQ